MESYGYRQRRIHRGIRKDNLLVEHLCVGHVVGIGGWVVGVINEITHTVEIPCPFTHESYPGISIVVFDNDIGTIIRRGLIHHVFVQGVGGNIFGFRQRLGNAAEQRVGEVAYVQAHRREVGLGKHVGRIGRQACAVVNTRCSLSADQIAIGAHKIAPINSATCDCVSTQPEGSHSRGKQG